MRWLDPKFPTYREPLTEYPTIINSTQFGYGRRLCMGQTVAYHDMLVGIASIAWLFNISKHEPQPLFNLSNQVPAGKKPTVTVETNDPNEDEDGEPDLPGSFPPTPIEELTQKPPCKVEDPTLDYSILLIAKPLPFEFDLSVRSGKRADLIRDLFTRKKQAGDFSDARVFWGENEELGWGKV
jgi:hypothetical protein